MDALPTTYDTSWHTFFASQSKLLASINQKLEATTATIYPPKEHIFKAFSLTPVDQVKVVILGQDPYHGEGEAVGLAFSVEQGTKMPPSLRNIFKELKSDCGITRISTDLSDWADQGILLINAILTVEKDKAGSHATWGWEEFTHNLITYLSSLEQPILFVLWGNYARKKAPLVTGTNHDVLEGVHPSPLSAYRGFFDSRPFSFITTWLEKHDLEAIRWED